MSFLNNLNFSWSRRLPLIRQTQTAECGLACVGMIANFYGHQIDIVTLRRRFSTSLKGAMLSDVISVAQRLNLNTRALRVELEELPKLKCPCILHWDLNHFVVLKKATAAKLTVYDPARGVRVIPLKAASSSFTGVALELVPTATFQPKKEKESISMMRLIGSVVGIKSAFTQVLILSVALEVFGIIGPFFMQWVMDLVLVSADHALLTLLGVGFIMVAIFQNLITALRSWVVNWFSSLLSIQWTANVCSHMLKLPLSWFESRHVGDVLSRFGSLKSIQDTLTTRFISTVLDGVMSIVTLAMLFIYNAQLAWLVIGLFLSYAVIRFVSYRPLRLASEEQIVSSARTQSSLLESLRGIQAIKTNNKQDSRLSIYMNYLVDTTNKGINIQKLNIFFGTTQGLISSIGRVILIWLAAIQVLNGDFSAGMMTAFISFADQFISRASGLINAVIDFRMLRMHGERLADIVLSEIEHDVDGVMPPENAPEAVQDEDITIQGLRFRYAETEPWVIDGIDMAIKSGESVAIVGPSGMGKTTLAKIILGLLHPQEGKIFIGKNEITHIGLKHHREYIGCVLQDDILFSGSIADNISFFDENPDMARIMHVAHIAQIHEDIMRMPMNYQSLVGDMGAFLSGGQIQRVLLARALYRKPKVLILDEATSHLDVNNESLINNAIKNMQITRIIVAHRPETIRSADRVVVLNKGKAFETQAGNLLPPEI